MRIAQIAPLYEAVPPKTYGGTERVVSYLTEELVRQGHEVTLFASAESATAAELVATAPHALRLQTRYVDPTAQHLLLMERVFEESERFDLMHFHTDYLHLPFTRRCDTVHLTTLHGRLDLPDLEAVFREYAMAPVVSISDAQRKPLPWLNWQGTVYHGLPLDLHRVRQNRGRYLAFVGRFCPDKGFDRAAAIAERVHMPLKVAAKKDPDHDGYFAEVVAPLLQRPGIEYLGELGERDKGVLLRNAYALLFPIAWPEPFGLVMIEAMACGTPVIAYAAGSVPEVVDDGITGFIVRSEREAVRALEDVGTVSRQRCREVFEQRFSVRQMACGYLAIYRDLLKRDQAKAIAA